MKSICWVDFEPLRPKMSRTRKIVSAPKWSRHPMAIWIARERIRRASTGVHAASMVGAVFEWETGTMSESHAAVVSDTCAVLWVGGARSESCAACVAPTPGRSRMLTNPCAHPGDRHGECPASRRQWTFPRRGAVRCRDSARRRRDGRAFCTIAADRDDGRGD